MIFSSGLQDINFLYLLSGQPYLLLFLWTSPPCPHLSSCILNIYWSLESPNHSFNYATYFPLLVAEQNTREDWKSGMNKVTIVFQNGWISSVGINVIHQH